MTAKYNHLALGGTFDHFHSGHEAFLLHAFSLASKVSIGLTTDSFLKTKELKKSLESYEVRKNSLETFLKRNNLLGRAHIFSLSDIFGVAIQDDVDAILVTHDTMKNGQKINKKRKELGLPAIPIEVTPLIQGSDKKAIKSERVRAGEITRAGNAYKSIFSRVLRLPETLRAALRTPLGIVIKGEEDTKSIEQNLREQFLTLSPTMIIAVGDVIVNSLRSFGMRADIEIIDYRTRRHTISSPEIPLQKGLYNKPGTINPKAVSKLQNAIKVFLKTKKTQTIVVSGEEDLLALPAILLAPLNSVVLYGQFDLGVIVTKVTEGKKDKIVTLVAQFE